MFKFCIAGKNDIAVNALEYLLLRDVSSSEIAILCNSTDNGIDGWQKSLRYAANKHGVKEIQLEDVYSISDIIFISLEYERLIQPNLFNTQFLFNVHFSLLPKYRGAYTSIFPILNNEEESGVTLHFIDSGIDTGDIIMQQHIKIDWNDTARDLYLKYIKYGTNLAKFAIDECLISPFRLHGIEQNKYKASFYSRKDIDFKNLKINTKQTAVNIRNQIRAYSFKEYQLPEISGRKIACADILPHRSTHKPGTINEIQSNRCVLSTIDYDMLIVWCD